MVCHYEELRNLYAAPRFLTPFEMTGGMVCHSEQREESECW